MSKGHTINHFSHKHPLSEVNGVGTYTCDGCKLYGNSKTYRCSDCDYDLHEYCAICPQSLKNSFHGPDHELSLIHGPQHMTERTCYVCRLYIQGMFYKCNHCSFESHPLCTHGPMHASSLDAPITTQRSMHVHEHAGQPSPPQHYGQEIPYAYPHMGRYATYPHAGHNHQPQPWPQHQQHPHHYVHPVSPKADTTGDSSKGKKKKKGVFGSLLAVAAGTGEAAATLLLATAADSVMNEE